MTVLSCHSKLGTLNWTFSSFMKKKIICGMVELKLKLGRNLSKYNGYRI